MTSITLRTPRDVRTLIPAGPAHAFITAYDGFFYDAAITATIRMRNGTTHTEPIPAADYPTPGALGLNTLPQFLSTLQRDAKQLQSQTQGSRARAIRAIDNIDARIARLKAMIAYRQAHRTLLPPN